MATLSDIASLAGALGSLVAVAVALNTMHKDRKEAIKEAEKRAAADAKARAEEQAILKQSLEEQKKLNKAFDKHIEKYDDLKDRVTKVEDSTKNAHIRIDKMEERIK